MSYQLARIDYEKNRALGIFTRTRDRFLKAISKARKYISENDSKVSSLQEEIKEKVAVNDVLYANIQTMNEHVEKINHLIGE